MFYNDIKALGWNDAVGAYGPLGKYQSIGGEAEATYRTSDTHFTFSHAVVKLLNINFDDGVQSLISAETVGVGDDLANWPAQITKLTVHRRFQPQVVCRRVAANRVGIPRRQRLQPLPQRKPSQRSRHADQQRQRLGRSLRQQLLPEPGPRTSFQPARHAAFDAYNVLGWIDRAYNKRLFTDNGFEGEYREEAPSVGLTFRYSF